MALICHPLATAMTPSTSTTPQQPNCLAPPNEELDKMCCIAQTARSPPAQLDVDLNAVLVGASLVQCRTTFLPFATLLTSHATWTNGMLYSTICH